VRERKNGIILKVETREWENVRERGEREGGRMSKRERDKENMRMLEEERERER
jgi:hypothetical protein